MVNVYKPLLHVVGLAIGSLCLCSVSLTEVAPDDDAVILKDVLTVDIRDHDKIDITVHRIVEIRNRSGTRYSEVRIVESPFNELKRFSAVLYDSDGKAVAEYEKDDGSRICGFSGYALYQDVCHWLYQIHHARYPYTIDFIYTKEAKSLFFWPGWQPRSSIPVHEAQYILSVPEEVTYRREARDGVVPDSVTGDDGDSTYYFGADSLSALGRSHCAGSYSLVRPRLRFAPLYFKLGGYEFHGDTWADLGSDYDRMIDRSFDLNDDQKDIIDSLRSRISDDRELCERLHDILIPKSRYVAVEIGIGGWKPSRSKETFDRGYGDCKDLAIMYASMLRYAGIPAYPGILHVGESRHVNPDLPSINYFNHVILFALLDGDSVWIDPTCRFCDVGDLPSGDEVRYALVADDVSSGLVQTPASRADENGIVRTTEMTINGDRSLSIDLTIRPRGNIRHRFLGMIEHNGERELATICQKRLSWVADNVQIDSAACEGFDDERLPAGARISGIVRNAVHFIGDKRYIAIDFLPFLTPCESYRLSGDGPNSLDLGYPRMFLDSIIIRHADGWQPASALDNATVESEFGSAGIEYRVGENCLTLIRKRTSFGYAIDGDRLPEYLDHLTAVQDVMPTRVVMTSSETSDTR